MLNITESQMQVFEHCQVEHFEHRAVHHMREFDPEGFGTLSNEEQLETVREMRTRAPEVEARTEAEVILYAEIVCLLGEEFMKDDSSKLF